jgi:Icc-related predicted phosphoesterase
MAGHSGADQRGLRPARGGYGVAMRVLAFSDLHRDLDRAANLVEQAGDADVVVGAGDFAAVHEGLAETIAALSGIERPTVLVPGNNETGDALREAAASWPAATVLHGEGIEIDGVSFYGLGAGVPITPWDWSFDLDEERAAAMLARLPDDAFLVVHSPPRGHVDTADGEHLGSEAVLEAIERARPRIAVCGHIHDCWGQESRIGPTRVLNLGPDGIFVEV